MDSSDNLSELSPQPVKKKSGRKAKKNCEREISDALGDFEKDKMFSKQKKLYENMHYLSPKEKQMFENKFTKPKNKNQEEYVHHLRNKNRKIIVASGPAGTGKTLFATEYGVRNFLLGLCDKLIFTRPSVSVDEEIGFLPGTLEEKIIEIAP
jgi:phosphate starvation-inducible PhoH-like protein